MAWTDIDYIGSAAEVVGNRLKEIAFRGTNSEGEDMVLDDLIERLHRVEHLAGEGYWQQACEAAQAFVDYLRPLADGTGDPTAGVLDATTAFRSILEIERGISDERRNNDLSDRDFLSGPSW